MIFQANYIPIEHAKNYIITALEQFDSELAIRASRVLYNEERLNIAEVSEIKTGMMQCRPAGLKIEDVQANDMYIHNFAARFGPHFTRQDNPTDHAIIDFEYDGSPRAIAWLAHELGHAMADDLQRENGHNYKDFTTGEQEEQAYFIQHIVSTHLKSHMDRPDAQDEPMGQNILKMSWQRANQYTKADHIFKSALTATPSERYAIALKALDQRLV